MGYISLRTVKCALALALLLSLCVIGAGAWFRAHEIRMVEKAKVAAQQAALISMMDNAERRQELIEIFRRVDVTTARVLLYGGKDEVLEMKRALASQDSLLRQEGR